MLGRPSLRVSVITPSLNQGPFLEDTLRSVLDQGYENLEYIIIDGGSSDESVEILRRYQDRFAFWVSEPDRGQADAINKGMQRATGDIVAYLNSDDLYLPGALNAVSREFEKQPECQWLTGGCTIFGGTDVSYSPPFIPPDPLEWLHRNRLLQPAVFWRRSLMERHGLFDTELTYSFDYEYWIRLVFAGESCRVLPFPVAAFRVHSASKTSTSWLSFERECELLRERYRWKLPPKTAQAFPRLFAARQLTAKAEDLAWKRRWRESAVTWMAAIRVRPELLLDPYVCKCFLKSMTLRFFTEAHRS